MRLPLLLGAASALPALLLALGLALGAGGCSSSSDAKGEGEEANELNPAQCEVSGFEWGHGGEDMLPGTACIDCHRPAGKARSVFTVAGTVFESGACTAGVAGAVVHVEDADGNKEQLTTTELGNFYTEFEFTPPLRVSVERDGVVNEMSQPTNVGDCNTCHVSGTSLGLVHP